MSYEFRYVRDHIEVFDSLGRFCFSADNKLEALQELREGGLAA